MLRMIEKKGETAIWKASDNRTGVVDFYGIRPADAKDTPFNSKHNTLRDAREALETA